MLTIRLSRRGTKNRPFYRIVAQEKRSKQDGKAVDLIGWFNPIKKTVNINQEKLSKWLETGAQVSPAVKKLIKA